MIYIVENTYVAGREIARTASCTVLTAPREDEEKALGGRIRRDY
jgi:hypothetical protein